MHEKCQICGMYTDSEEGRQQGILFHHFPVARPNICREWLDVVGVERLRQLPPKQLRNRTVCSRHFRHSSYPGPLSKMLYKDAVPERSVPEHESGPRPRPSAAMTAAPTTCTPTASATATTTTTTITGAVAATTISTPAATMNKLLMSHRSSVLTVIYNP
ncbi:uncharacterized protein [Anabrus simplex]|uniref:uncharacterized protein n=1 Tax=Anabrus simplex TaxID=316456 RepID=UPI0035A27471